MELGSTGLPKEESMAPSHTSFESFIFSFSSEVEVFRFLHSRCVNQLFPRQHLLSAWQEVLFLAGWIFLISLPAFYTLTFCFVFISLPYLIPLSMALLWVLLGLFPALPVTYIPSPPTLAPSASLSCPTPVPACWKPTPGTSPHTLWFCTHIPLCVGHSVGTPYSWPSLLVTSSAAFVGEASFLSLPGDMDLAKKRAILLIFQVACAFCEQITDSESIWRYIYTYIYMSFWVYQCFNYL